MRWKNKYDVGDAMNSKATITFYLQALCAGLLFAVIYWIVEAYIHTYVFHTGTFLSQLLPSSNELWMRIFIAVLFIIAVLVLAYLMRQKIVLSNKLLPSDQALHAMREGCVITNHLNEIIYVNPQYEKISGYTFQEVKGKNPGILSSGKQDASFYQNLWETLSKEGFWEGEIWNKNKSGELYAERISISAIKNKRGEVRYRVGIFSDITSQKRVEEQVKYYAYYDALTHLPNRRLFTERLQYTIQIAKRKKEKLAVLFLDIDKFKLINDQYGHLVGDQFLREVARQLKNSIRASDTVSRFGGDEFVLLLQNIQSKETAMLTANKLFSSLGQSDIEIDSHHFPLKVSIGGAIYPDDSEDAETLIQYADQAMYQVKKMGGHNIIFTQ